MVKEIITETGLQANPRRGLAAIVFFLDRWGDICIYKDDGTHDSQRPRHLLKAERPNWVLKTRLLLSDK